MGDFTIVPDRYLSRKELAEFCGVSLSALVKRGVPVPDVVVGGVKGWSEATAGRYREEWGRRGPGRPPRRG